MMEEFFNDRGILLLKIKWVCDIAKRKSFLSSFSVMFRFGLWLKKRFNLNKPKLYLRYFDDILAAFQKEQDSLHFLNFLNNEHPNIKFTIEKQVNHSIAFYHIPSFSGIYSQNLTLQTYHKSTYTGLFLNFKSLHRFHTRLV